MVLLQLLLLVSLPLLIPSRLLMLLVVATVPLFGLSKELVMPLLLLLLLLLCLMLLCNARKCASFPQVDANKWPSIHKDSQRDLNLAKLTIDFKALIVSDEPIVWDAMKSIASLSFDTLPLLNPNLKAWSESSVLPLDSSSRAFEGPRSSTNLEPPPQPQQTPTFAWTKPISASANLLFQS